MPNDYHQHMNQSGENLLKAINGLTQIAKIHQDNNNLLVDAVKKFIHLIGKLDLDRTDVTIQLSDGRFYFQEQKLIIRPANAKLFNRMQRFIEDRDIFGFHFKSDLKEIAPQKIISFFRLIDQAVNHENSADWLAAQLVDQDLNWVSVAQVPLSLDNGKLPLAAELSLSDEWAAKKAQVRKSYAHVLSSIKEVARKLSSNQSVGMRNSVRLVQKMVDIISEDETLFLGISTIRIYDDYTYAHSLNVAILAMCLGKRIGLSHIMLERLGLCGLFHDLGKVEIPAQLLNKKEALSDEEYAMLQTHSMHSARLILKLKAKSDRKGKILVPPFEHHMGYDHSGYPKVATGPRISLFGRILTIADVYDAITSPRIYRKNAMSPDRALAQLTAQSGTHFDPVLLKVFINMLGVYPTGTALKLDSGEMGIVIKPSNTGERNRPIVQLIVGDARKKYQKGTIADLSQRNENTGQYLYNIAQSMHPSAIGVQAAEFLLL